MTAMRPAGRRRPLPLVASAVTAAALLLAGCSGSDDDPGTSPAETGAAASAAFPVTVTHKLGSTTVESEPKRIVALSDADIDALLAFGVQPVAVGESIGDDGLTPWARPKYTGKPPVLSPGDNGYDVEKILALEPDLVLAGGDYTIDAEYQGLTDAGVPVTAYESGPSEDAWQVTVRQVGKAIGRSAQAEEVVTDVEAQIAKVRTDQPSIVGKRFSLSQMWEAGSIGVLRSTEDSGVRMLDGFGLELDPKVAALQGEDFAVQLSLEKVGTLDSDLLLVYYADPALQPKLEANALFAALPAVKAGRYVPLADEQFSALRSATPLSVPYTIQQVVPLLVKASGAAGA